MSINIRLKAVCDNKKIKNIDLVKLGCGSQQTVSFVLTGKSKPNTEFIETFLTEYTDVNARWLLTGEGKENIVEDPRTNYGFCKECLRKEGEISRLEKECAKKDKRIEELSFKLGERGAGGQTASAEKAS